ncbi:aminoglycoside adenylyltransferase domain-containing protein [Plantactinospora solaniradicis]|uniref:Aminoglycoside adenylyltransferase domain-containing protein n=1 Tax=Plantactinospora solaniradicis TaxID=1723736 RepID=A0ABW1K3D5_9ACTN
MTSTLPPAETAYLAAVLDRLAAVLGDSLLGVYPTGSLALDGYAPGRSDIDLIAVVERADPVVLEKVAARLSHDALPCPATGLEFVLYERAAVAASGTGAGFALNLNTGRELPPKVGFGPGDEATFWYPIDRAISSQQGVALLGPAPRTLLAPTPFAALLPVVVESVAARLHADLDLGDNAVLNGCRSLRFATERRWYPKRSAAEWAIGAVPEFGPLIGAALRSYARGRTAGNSVDGTQARAFLAVLLGRLDQHRHASATAARRAD